MRPIRPRLGNCFSERAPSYSLRIVECSSEGRFPANIRGGPSGRQRRTAPSESVSRMEHPLNAGVHLFFLNELAARNFIDADPHLLIEPLVMGKQVRVGIDE